MKTYDTLIVGAGWSGLAAAFSLTQKNQRVLVLEAAPNAGGRARAVPFGEEWVDNGQHIGIGAYTETLNLLKTLNIPEETLFERRPLEWSMFNVADPKKPVYFSFKHYGSFLKTQGLTLKEQWSAFLFYKALKKNRLPLATDISVSALLQKTQQPLSLIQKLWEPLALAALSTPIEQASAHVFVHILKKFFEKTKQGALKNSDILLPKKNLSDCFPNPMIDYLIQHGSDIVYHERAQKLIFENNQCIGVETLKNRFTARNVILATPPHITHALLESNPISKNACTATIDSLARFRYEPITTLYLEYPSNLPLKYPMMGILNGTAHWLFQRTFAEQPHILSVVITGLSHDHLSHAQKVEAVLKDLALIHPTLASPIASRVIMEKRAAFSCTVGIEAQKPSQRTPIPHLYLTGDYTEPLYPATLEAAVKSGVNVAMICTEWH